MINSVLKGNLTMLCLKLDFVICVGSFLLSSNIVMVENFFFGKKSFNKCIAFYKEKHYNASSYYMSHKTFACCNDY